MNKNVALLKLKKDSYIWWVPLNHELDSVQFKAHKHSSSSCFSPMAYWTGWSLGFFIHPLYREMIARKKAILPNLLWLKWRSDKAEDFTSTFKHFSGVYIASNRAQVHLSIFFFFFPSFLFFPLLIPSSIHPLTTYPFYEYRRQSLTSFTAIRLYTTQGH